MGGLIFGIVRVLVNWWAYTWGGLYSGGLIFGGLRYWTSTLRRTGRNASVCVLSIVRCGLFMQDENITYFVL